VKSLKLGPDGFITEIVVLALLLIGALIFVFMRVRSAG
jgi:hypothetical protein